MTESLAGARGGLQYQLREFATRVSIDGGWQQPVAQTVQFERKASIPHREEASFAIQFEARRFHPVRESGEKSEALRTVYMLRALEVQDQLVYDELPENVAANMVSLTPADADSRDVVVLSFDGSDSETPTTEQLVEDFRDDDIRYRFERTMQYRLDGRAALLACEYGERYVSLDDDDEEEIYAQYSTVPGTLREEAADVMALAAWPDRAVREGIPIEPQLFRLELAFEKRDLQGDLDFLELIQSYANSPELERAVRAERAETMLAMLAFLRFEGGFADIRNRISFL